MNPNLITGTLIDCALPLFFPFGGAELKLFTAATQVCQSTKSDSDFVYSVFRTLALGRISALNLEKRADTFCHTLRGLAAGIQNWHLYQDKDSLATYPAAELIAASSRDRPAFHAAVDRWTSLGHGLTQGRMIAVKNDRIWLLMSDLGFPFPPYSPTCRLVLEDVSREEALGFGIRKVPTPIPELPFDLEKFSAGVRRWIEAAAVSR